MKKIIIIFCLIFSIVSCGRVKELGVFGKSRKLHVLGQDGVTPIKLTNTITMWTFGDTIHGSWKEDISASATFSDSVNISGMIPNSLAFTDNPNNQNIINLNFTFLTEKGQVSQFIKYYKNENPKKIRLWAVDGIRIEKNIYVYYIITKIKKTKELFDFEPHGIGIAKWRMPDNWKIGNKVNFKRLGNLFPSTYPAFGTCAIKKGKFIYTVGQCISADKTSPIKIARVKPSKIDISNAYTFLAKDGKWTKDINIAESFFGDVMGECSISYNEYLKKYIIVYCQLWTGKIIIVKFNDFSKLSSAEKEIIYEPPSLKHADTQSPVFYYSGKEILSINKYIYIIYINPIVYQPYLIKLRLY